MHDDASLWFLSLHSELLINDKCNLLLYILVMKIPHQNKPFSNISADVGHSLLTADDLVICLGWFHLGMPVIDVHRSGFHISLFYELSSRIIFEGSFV